MKMIALYDNSCSLCKETKKWLEKLDILKRIEWVSLQEYEKQNHSTSFSFSKEDLRKELHIIDQKGKVYKGFFAVRKLLVTSPLTIIIGVLLYIPFASFIGVPIYEWIAKNRHRFLRKNCSDGSCSL